MNSIIKPGRGILFMKVGTHAQEELASIIARKSEEIKATGFGMWGYGGNTCHPTSMVQPFAHSFTEAGETIYLCMEEVKSNHAATPLCAAEYSHDGIEWITIPKAIEVRGSRYALVIDELRREKHSLSLNSTRVPVGPSMGRNGGRYIKGRVDKACLEVLDHPEIGNEDPPREISISLVARMAEPYAVFLRGQR